MMASGYALIGENERAFRWLEHAIDYGICNPSYLGSRDPFLAKLRSDNRFDTLLAKAQQLSNTISTAGKIGVVD